MKSLGRLRTGMTVTEDWLNWGIKLWKLSSWISGMKQEVTEVSILGCHTTKQYSHILAGKANTVLAQLARNDFLADIAQQSGLDACTTLCIRQEHQITPPATLKYTVTAVIGAVWLDSNRNFDSTVSVMQKLREAYLL